MRGENLDETVLFGFNERRRRKDRFSIYRVAETRTVRENARPIRVKTGKRRTRARKVGNVRTFIS